MRLTISTQALLLSKNQTGQRLRILLDSPQGQGTLARTRTIQLIRKALIESCLQFSDLAAKVSEEIKAESKQKMLIFDKTKLQRFVAYVEAVATQQVTGEEDMADVVHLLMRDESKLTAERASVFVRTSEHAKYTKHMISACRDTIVPALSEV